MKIIQKKLKKTSVDRLLRAFIFCFLFSFASINISLAQESDSITVPDSATTAATAEADGFAKKENTAKLFAEAREMQEKSKRDQILQYVVMVAGFSVVIGIAWFTTVLARKRKKKDDEIKAMRHRQMKNKLHPPRR